MMKLLLIFFLWQDCLKADIVLVGDFSGSVQGKERFIRKAFQSIVDGLSLNEDGIKVGVVYFDSHAILVHPLTAQKFKLDSVAAGGGTNMTEALQLTFNELITHGRPDARKLVVLVSDGEPDDKLQTRLVADQLSKAGVLLCGVWVGTGDEDYMKELCPIYRSTDYPALLEQIKQLSDCL